MIRDQHEFTNKTAPGTQSLSAEEELTSIITALESDHDEGIKKLIKSVKKFSKSSQHHLIKNYFLTIIQEHDELPTLSDVEANEFIEVILLITEKYPSPLSLKALQVFHKFLLNPSNFHNNAIIFKNFGYNSKNIQRLNIRAALEDNRMREITIEYALFFLNNYQAANITHFTDSIELIETLNWDDRKQKKKLLDKLSEKLDESSKMFQKNSEKFKENLGSAQQKIDSHENQIKKIKDETNKALNEFSASIEDLKYFDAQILNTNEDVKGELSVLKKASGMLEKSQKAGEERLYQEIHNYGQELKNQILSEMQVLRRELGIDAINKAKLECNNLKNECGNEFSAIRKDIDLLRQELNKSITIKEQHDAGKLENLIDKRLAEKGYGNINQSDLKMGISGQNFRQDFNGELVSIRKEIDMLRQELSKNLSNRDQLDPEKGGSSSNSQLESKLQDFAQSLKKVLADHEQRLAAQEKKPINVVSNPIVENSLHEDMEERLLKIEEDILNLYENNKKKHNQNQNQNLNEDNGDLIEKIKKLEDQIYTLHDFQNKSILQESITSEKLMRLASGEINYNNGQSGNVLSTENIEKLLNEVLSGYDYKMKEYLVNLEKKISKEYIRIEERKKTKKNNNIESNANDEPNFVEKKFNDESKVNELVNEKLLRNSRESSDSINDEYNSKVQGAFAKVNENFIRQARWNEKIEDFIATTNEFIGKSNGPNIIDRIESIENKILNHHIQGSESYEKDRETLHILQEQVDFLKEIPRQCNVGFSRVDELFEKVKKYLLHLQKQIESKDSNFTSQKLKGELSDLSKSPGVAQTIQNSDPSSVNELRSSLSNLQGKVAELEDLKNFPTECQESFTKINGLFEKVKAYMLAFQNQLNEIEGKIGSSKTGINNSSIDKIDVMDKKIIDQLDQRITKLESLNQSQTPNYSEKITKLELETQDIYKQIESLHEDFMKSGDEELKLADKFDKAEKLISQCIQDVAELKNTSKSNGSAQNQTTTNPTSTTVPEDTSNIANRMKACEDISKDHKIKIDKLAALLKKTIEKVNIKSLEEMHTSYKNMESRLAVCETKINSDQKTDGLRSEAQRKPEAIKPNNSNKEETSLKQALDNISNHTNEDFLSLINRHIIENKTSYDEKKIIMTQFVALQIKDLELKLSNQSTIVGLMKSMKIFDNPREYIFLLSFIYFILIGMRKVVDAVQFDDLAAFCDRIIDLNEYKECSLVMIQSLAVIKDKLKFNSKEKLMSESSTVKAIYSYSFGLDEPDYDENIIKIRYQMTKILTQKDRLATPPLPSGKKGLTEDQNIKKESQVDENNLSEDPTISRPRSRSRKNSLPKIRDSNGSGGKNTFRISHSKLVKDAQE